MKSVVFFLFLFSSCFALTCNATNQLSNQAEQFYKTKKYNEAISAYEKLLQEGYHSYQLHYNLGNAYYKTNQIGKAIYQYELANKLNPNSEDVKTNLRIANNKTIDKIDTKENLFIGVIKFGLVNYYSTTGWAWLSVASLVFCLALAFLFYISQSITIKQISFFGSAVSVIVFITAMLLGYTSLKNKKSIDYAIITTREVKIVDEPNETGTSKFSLHDGTKVSVIETKDEWTNIKLQNGNEGWVKTSAIGLF